MSFLSLVSHCPVPSSTGVVCLGLMLASTGCEHKEKVLEIKAPGVDVEVNKTSDGKREVDIKSDGHRRTASGSRR